MMAVTHSKRWNTCARDGGVIILSCLCAVICHVRQDRVRCSCSSRRSSDTGEAVRGATGISPHTAAPLLLINGMEKGKRYLDGTMSPVFEWEGVRGCYFILHVCTSVRSWKDRVTRSYSVKNSCSASRHAEIHLILVTVLNNECRTESCDCILRVHRLPSRGEWANYSPAQMTINHVSLPVLLGNR